MLYADTALNGEVAATRCGHAFFNTAHCLFATDAPFYAEQGRGLIAKTIAAVNALEIRRPSARIFGQCARADDFKQVGKARSAVPTHSLGTLRCPPYGETR